MFKYRGKHKITGEMVYGYFTVIGGQSFIITDESESVPVEPDSIGVKVDVDRNGNEIYTGDKVHMKLYVPINNEHAAELEEDFEVIFSQSNYGFALAHEKLPDGFIMLDSLIYGLSEKAVLASKERWYLGAKDNVVHAFDCVTKQSRCKKCDMSNIVPISSFPLSDNNVREKFASLANDSMKVCPDCVQSFYYNGE